MPPSVHSDAVDDQLARGGEQDDALLLLGRRAVGAQPRQHRAQQPQHPQRSPAGTAKTR